MVDSSRFGYSQAKSDHPKTRFTTPELSILVVHYRTLVITLKCLESIYAFPPDCSFEVILVDNGSDDGIEEIISERFPQVRFLESGGNVGFARANNLGIHNSRGKHVLLLNSDARVTDEALTNLMQYVRSNPNVGAVGPRHVDMEGLFQMSCGTFPNLVSEVVRKIMHYRLSLYDYRVRDYLEDVYSNTMRVDWISGSCLLVTRAVLYEIGLLDERFFMYFEDIDLCRRINDAGKEVHYVHSVSIEHHGGASARNNLLSVMIENRKSQLYFGHKYYGMVGEVVIRVILLMKYGLHFVRAGLALIFSKITGFEDRRVYTTALLSKKVILVVMKNFERKAEIPILHEHSKKVITHE